MKSKIYIFLLTLIFMANYVSSLGVNIPTNLLSGNGSQISVNDTWLHRGLSPQQVADLFIETDPSWRGNYTIFTGLINNASYLSTYNSTYNNLLNQQCPVGQVVNGTLSNGTFTCIASSGGLFWNQTGNQNGLSGIKNGTYNLTTTGTGTFGNVNVNGDGSVSGGLTLTGRIYQTGIAGGTDQEGSSNRLTTGQGGIGSGDEYAGRGGTFDILTGNGGTENGAGAEAGTGGTINIYSGIGGFASVNSIKGGDGGYLNIYSGGGGWTTSTNGRAGTGGTFFTASGPGGLSYGSGGTKQGGDGGAYQFQSGQGGYALSGDYTNTGGNGGSFTFYASGGGSGGTPLSGGTANTGGNGGNMLFTAGEGAVAQGGSSYNTGGNGGTITFASGIGGVGTGAGATNGTDGDIIFKKSTIELARFSGTTGLAWFVNNVSAKAYITRTSIYDINKGSALNYIKDASSYLSNGIINHSAFYGYVTYETADYSRPVIINHTKPDCRTILDKNGNPKQECKDIIVQEITYPYKTTEQGVDLGKEIDVLRQGAYELKLQNQALQNNITSMQNTINKLCSLAPKGTC